MKKKTAKKSKDAVKWFDHAAKLPIGLFHTTLGPIIGKFEKAPADMGQFRIRLWAPAIIQVGFVPAAKVTPGQGAESDGNTSIQQRIVFQPIALIETHLDLSVATPFGRSPVPASIVPGYKEYFAKFSTGEYAISRVVAKVEQGAPHVVDPPAPAAEAPSDSETPPSGQPDDSHVS